MLPVKIKYWFIISVFLMTACDPFHTHIGDKVKRYCAARNITHCPLPDTLSIMTWNIKFGGGRIDFFFDCHGDRVIMTADEVNGNMENLAQKIRQTDPDILFVQEIDVDSKRSANINQLQYLLDNTKLNYGVYASQWKASYIPSHNLGRIESGNAILSKWDFQEAHRVALPLIKEQNFIVRYFYLKRNLLEARLQTPHGQMVLLNTHTSAYARDNTKKLQLQIIKEHIDNLNNQNLPFILAGDFNTIPPFSMQVKDFEDSACTKGEYEANDYSQETQWMMPFYRDYNAAIPLNKFKQNNGPHFTHTTDKKGFWNRKLDYIFSNNKFIAGSSTTLQQWMQISDHAPITTQYPIKQ